MVLDQDERKHEYKIPCNTKKRQLQVGEVSRHESEDEIDEEMFKAADEEVKGVISDVVTERTKATYRNANITFLMWIYDGGVYKRRLLREKFINEMDEAKDNKEQRNVCKKWLDGNECEDDCPILLFNLNFKIFSRYLAERKDKNNGKYLSKSTYGNLQSAVCHLYRLCDVQFPDDFSADLSKIMSGFKKRVQR